MFKELKDQDKTSRLTKVAGQYSEGITLYKAFLGALGAQDRTRTPRLGVRFDSWYSALKTPQKAEFCALLVQEGLITTGPLATAIKIFEARFK